MWTNIIQWHMISCYFLLARTSTYWIKWSSVASTIHIWNTRTIHMGQSYNAHGIPHRTHMGHSIQYIWETHKTHMGHPVQYTWDKRTMRRSNSYTIHIGHIYTIAALLKEDILQKIWRQNRWLLLPIILIKIFQGTIFTSFNGK